MTSRAVIERFPRKSAPGAALLLFAVLFACGPACAQYCIEAPNSGDSMAEVSAKCGEAALKDQRTLTVEETDREGSRKTVTVIDQWTYDRGPQELVLTFRFENGKVAGITPHGYGSFRDFSVETCRNGAELAIGDTMVDAYLKCGNPLSRENLAHKSKIVEQDGVRKKTELAVQEWTYRYGRELPGYTVTFEDGMTVEIRTREFGK